MAKKCIIFLTFSADNDTMNGMTVNEIGEALGIHPKAAKTRLRRAGIEPIDYAGPTAIYPMEAVETIRSVPGRGRPKKQPVAKKGKK
jgi:predicted ArsR family transcriptional regulator